jgi:hypothetical protein
VSQNNGERRSKVESFDHLPSSRFFDPVNYYSSDNMLRKKHASEIKSNFSDNSSVVSSSNDEEFRSNSINAENICRIFGCNNLKSKQSQYCTAHTGTNICLFSVP